MLPGDLWADPFFTGCVMLGERPALELAGPGEHMPVKATNVTTDTRTTQERPTVPLSLGPAK